MAFIRWLFRKRKPYLSPLTLFELRQVLNNYRDDGENYDS